MDKMINRIPGSCLLISSLPGSASLIMSTSVLKALPGKLDFKRHYLLLSMCVLLACVFNIPFN